MSTNPERHTFAAGSPSPFTTEPAARVLPLTRKPTMNELAIEVTGLHKQFGPKAVLNGVDLQIPRGRVIGLLGLNGSGKTTLIKHLLGLLKPTSGSVTVLGRDAWHLDDEQKIKIGYVPQEITLYPWMTVRQTVDYVSAFYRTWDTQWSDELLRRWELPLYDRLGPLSVGQKQKLALVLALGHRPELLILDEPVASLDPVARRWFLDRSWRWQRMSSTRCSSRRTLHPTWSESPRMSP